LLDECVALLGAPRAVVAQCSEQELFGILINANVPAEQMQAAMADDAKKKPEQWERRPRRKASR
jgi:hypothetical protein